MSKTIITGMLGPVAGMTVNTSLPCHPGNFNSYTSRKVSYIVMHYTGNSADLAKSNANYFTQPGRGASAHFFVDESSIWQSVRLHNMADGLPVWCNLVLAVMDEVNAAAQRERKRIDPRLAKFTAKYKKRQ